MLWNHLSRCLPEYRSLYGLCNATPVAKCVQIRLNKAVKKNVCHSLLQKFIDLCLEKSEIIHLKSETGIIFNRTNSCCEGTFFIMSFSSIIALGLCFFNCLTLSGILDPIVCASLIHFYAGNTRLVLLNQEASQLLYPASSKTFRIKGTVWKTPIKH